MDAAAVMRGDQPADSLEYKLPADGRIYGGSYPRPSAVAKVTSGEADATIVYQTDVTAAGSKGTGVPIPDNQNVIATYPIAIVKASGNQAAAAAYIDAIVNGSGQQALSYQGFLPPT